MAEENPLEIVSQITEFNDMSKYMNDKHLDKVMERVIKLIASPNIPVEKARLLIVELQATSAFFALKAVHYATIAKDRAGTENNNKKNIYYSTKEAIDKLVDALKYAARV